ERHRPWLGADRSRDRPKGQQEEIVTERRDSAHESTHEGAQGGNEDCRVYGDAYGLAAPPDSTALQFEHELANQCSGGAHEHTPARDEWGIAGAAGGKVVFASNQ